MERIRRVAAEAETRDLEGDVQGQENDQEVVKDRDLVRKNAEVGLTPAPEETGGIGLEAGRGGGLGIEEIGIEGGAEAGEGETEVEVGIEREIGHRNAFLALHRALLNIFGPVLQFSRMMI